MTDAPSAVRPGSRAHDGLINVHFGDREQPEWMREDIGSYFKTGPEVFDRWDISQVLDEMDALGIERAVLNVTIGDPPGSAIRFVEERPDRFALAARGLDLLRPMPTLARLASFVADHPVAYACIGPSFWGDGRYPPSDAVYFPLYTKCCELELPLCMNAGIPGPFAPGAVQDPIHHDLVCVRFPELALCMIHGADPWWDTAIRLLVKYPNLHLMTSAWAPKYLPESLLHLMRTRGKAKVLFASDAPVLSMTRTLGEARQLELPGDALDAYLYGNAQRLFFDRLETA